MRMMLIGSSAVLLLAAQGLHAEASLTVTGVSDYDFRGISQSDGDSAWQASFDYSNDSGFYAGVWGSTIDFEGSQTYSDGSSSDVLIDGSAEVDLYAGFSGEFAEGWSWDVGATYYMYPGSTADFGDPAIPDDDVYKAENYWEFYVGGGWAPLDWLTVDLKYWYSPDLYDAGDTASYVELNPSISLPWEVALDLHFGYSFGDYFDALESTARADDPGYNGDNADYYDYAIGLGRSFGHFDFKVMYVGTITDGNYWDVESGIFRNDERIIVSVSTTLPWDKSE